MKPLLILISLFIWSSQAQAQKQPTQTRAAAWEQFKADEGNNWKIRWNQQTGLPRTLIGRTSTKYSGTPVIAAKAFLSDQSELFAFKTNLSDLRHLKTKEHRGVRHVTFQQYFKGLKVEGAQYKVHLRKDGTVDMANGFYYSDIDIQTSPSVSIEHVISIAIKDLDSDELESHKSTAELVVYPFKENVLLAYDVNVLSEQPFTNWSYMVDALTGAILKKYNNITSFVNPEHIDLLKKNSLEPVAVTNEASDLFVTGTVNVYPKHPGLTPNLTVKNIYGLDGNGYLQGTYVTAEHAKTFEPYRANHNFQFPITNTYFDQASLYYHVDNFRRNYIEQLDENNNLFTHLKAFSYSDNVCQGGSFGACFNPNDGNLYFGNSLPFAKEDKVAHHEYGHAVVHDIESEINSYFEGEAGAISEGTPDYFAGAFTGRPLIAEHAFPSEQRDMEDPEISSYTEYENADDFPYVGSHIGGEFFSSILWDIRNSSGISASDADDLVFDALFRVSGDPDFVEFRDAMITSDNVQNQGDHCWVISEKFADKGVDSNQPVFSAEILGPDLIFQGSSTSWGVSARCGMTPYTYTWSVSTNSAFGPYTQVGTGSSYGQQVNQDIWLKAVAQENCGGTVCSNKQDVLYVEVISPCSNPPCPIPKRRPDVVEAVPEKFTLQNNYPNPFNPSTQIKFDLPEMAEVSVKVYNIMGQEVATLVNSQMQAGFHTTSFNAVNLASGVYIARLSAIGSSGEQFVSEIKMQLIK